MGGDGQKLNPVNRQQIHQTPVAVMLDMDGTLVDSDAAVHRSWSQWAVEHDLEPDTVCTLAVGAPAIQTIRQLFPDWSDGQVAAEAARQLDRECRDVGDIRAAAGAHGLLDLFNRTRSAWAVVTSANRRLAHARLNRARIDPPLLITIDDVSAGKPDPQGYLLAATRLGVDPTQCLVVEDSEAGLSAGLAAGAMVVSVKGHREGCAALDLTELARLLRGLYNDGALPRHPR